MKQLILLPFIIFALLLGGCVMNAVVTGQIQKKSAEQGAVFEELKDNAPDAGFSVLTIRAMMKTVKEGFYPLGSRNSLHGKPEYPFVFNIGGQGVVWMARGATDIQPRQTNSHRNPEGGEGVKYTLEKKIGIKPGIYRVYIGLSKEKLQKEINIILTGDNAGILEFKPVYRRDRGRGPRFHKGLSDFEVFLDGKKI